MQNNRTIWLIVLSTVLFLGAALVTLRAAEQANRPTAVQASGPAASATRAKPTHPPASAPEESATITDDPTTAPDPAQSADNNVSFPTDI
jgi:cytoskeletal protein RodZ